MTIHDDLARRSLRTRNNQSGRALSHGLTSSQSDFVPSTSTVTYDSPGKPHRRETLIVCGIGRIGLNGVDTWRKNGPGGISISECSRIEGGGRGGTCLSSAVPPRYTCMQYRPIRSTSKEACRVTFISMIVSFDIDQRKVCSGCSDMMRLPPLEYRRGPACRATLHANAHLDTSSTADFFEYRPILFQH